MRKPSIRRLALVSIAGLVSGVSLDATAFAGASPTLPDAPRPQISAGDNASLKRIPTNVVEDQRGIWTSPSRVRAPDLKWLLPLGVATAAAIATDHRTMTQVVTADPTINNDSTNASNVMVGGFIATPALLYGWGHFRQDEHARETGLLGAEALADGVALEQGMKLIFWRERPALDNGRGRFFQSNAGANSSFPSSHSVLAWTTAAVLASEYPRPVTQIVVYAAATGVSLSRVIGQQHFPSDVLVGATAGWLVGRYVYHRHHRLAHG